jgi:hypothetical protein
MGFAPSLGRHQKASSERPKAYRSRWKRTSSRPLIQAETAGGTPGTKG